MITSAFPLKFSRLFKQRCVTAGASCTATIIDIAPEACFSSFDRKKSPPDRSPALNSQARKKR
jgi:hypothetical protein